MNIRILTLIFLCLASFTMHASAERFLERQVTVNHQVFRYRVFVPDGWTSKRAWPVVLFLHGAGERGNDNRKQLSQGLPPWLDKHASEFPAVVVIPQVPENTYWTGDAERAAMQALDASIAEFHGDRNRLYLTGLSMGGYGAWEIAKDHPDMFAAAAIICGGLLPARPDSPSHVDGLPAQADPYAWMAERIGKLPVWIFHGSDDPVIPPAGSRAMHAALQQRGVEVRYTEFPGVGHAAWVPAYETPGLWPWMFSHAKTR